MSSDLAIAARLTAELRLLPEVRLAFLFGSRARGEARPDSDVDLAILVEESAAALDDGQLIRRLAGRLGRHVDSASLDIVLLHRASPLLRQRVLRDGKLLFARSDEERVRFARRTLREVQDFAIRRERHTRARILRLRQGRRDGRPRDLLAQARSAARLLGQAARVP